MSMSCGNCSSGMHQLQMVGDKFKAADTDGSETVSKQEFISALEETGLDTSKMDMIFSRIDSNGDGQISSQEQQDMMSMMEQRMGSLMGGSGGKSGEGFNSVTTLLETLQSESDSDVEKQRLQDALDNMRTGGHSSESAMSESLSLINGMIPGINASA